MSFVVIVTASLFYCQHAQSARCLDNDHERSKIIKGFRLDVDLMDKIAKRPYLHHYNTYGSRYYRGDDEYDDDYDDGESSDEANDCMLRPPGVPHTLRILALDMPEMKQAFSGGPCLISRQHTYRQGVAPPKRCTATAVVQNPTQEDDANNAVALTTSTMEDKSSLQHKHESNIMATSPSTTIRNEPSTTTPPASQPTKLVHIHYRVEQKSVAQAMLHCYNSNTHQISAQVLLGSIAQLNPNRTHPSKRRRSNDHSTSQEYMNSVDQAYSKIKGELEAPWNQHAWMDELELRIGGRVHFGAPMKRASALSRMLCQRNVYQENIPSSRTTLDWFLVPSLQTDPVGMDGKDELDHADQAITTNWASQKPHAVIASGVALRQVPGSLRLLQRLCDQEQVPLFIYQDQHSWRGCHSFDDFNELLYSLRQTVQQYVVRKALRCHQHDFIFACGRLLGQVEGDVRCSAKEHLRELTAIVRRYMQIDPSEMDWSKLDAAELEKKLRERKVINLEYNLLIGITARKVYSPAMVELSKQCISEHTPEKPRRRKWWLPPENERGRSEN